MITLALIATLLMQDTNTVISPRVRAMLDRFPPPGRGQPSISIRFSRDTVWVGEQVELVTATWFPRSIRDRLRRQPGISAPSLTNVWIARNQQLPIGAGTRVIDGQLYDIFLSWQTVFPLDAGRIDAPPATMTYNLPTSTAYFAPEEKKAFRSLPAALVVRPIPASLVASLGTGPTARNLRLSWRVPVGTFRAGAPLLVELAIVGDGNITLWPAAAISWPVGLHVYPEPTLEHLVPAQGLITGEKRFRFTVVSDSAGVVTLPEVRYPYFDPAAVQVAPRSAAAVTLPILRRTSAAADGRTLTVDGSDDIPIATRIVRAWWWALIAMALLPCVLIWRRDRSKVPTVNAAHAGDPEAELRDALGTPVDAGQDHVIAALRLRGVPRDEAEHIHRWLSAVSRRRYGPSKADLPDPPPVMSRVIARLRGGAALGLLLLAALPLRAQREAGVTRFDGGDFPGAARAFETALRDQPLAAALWRDLGASRWVQHDDVGAAAAWLYAMALAPRDPRLQSEWDGAASIPPDVRARAPTIPLSRDELLLVALVAWLVTGTAIARRRRRVALVGGMCCISLLGLAGARSLAQRPGQGLVIASTTLRISPHPATTAVGELAAWSLVRVERRHGNWILVGGQVSTPGSVVGLSVEGWIPAGSVASIGPLD